MKKEPPDELFSGQIHGLLPIVVTIVFPEKTNTFIFNPD
jgi:hypothetical protein